MKVLLVLLFLLLSGCGEDMWQVARQRDFTGGENQSELYERVGQNQLNTLKNCLIDQLGHITSDFQTDQVAITSGYTTNGFVFHKDTSGNYTVYANQGGDGTANCVYSYTYNTITNATLDVASFAKHTVSGGTVNFYGLQKAVPFLSKIYAVNTQATGILNLTDYTLITNGSLASGSVTKLREYSNRLWAVKSGALLCSNNGDATTWNTLNTIYLPNRDTITDFIPVQGGALVFGLTSVYAMYGSDYTDITFVKILDDVTILDGAVVQAGNTAYAHGLLRIYRVTLNGVDVVPMEQFTYFNSHMIVNRGSFTTNPRGVYLPKRDMVLFYYPPDSVLPNLDTAYGFWIDLKTGAVGKISIPAYSILPIDSPNVEFFSYTNNNVYSGYTPVTTRTTNKSSIIFTKFEDFGTTKDKIVRKISITVPASVDGFSLTYSINDIDTASYQIVSNATLSAGINDFYINSTTRCKSMRLKLLFTTTKPFKIQEIAVKYRVVGETK